MKERLKCYDPRGDVDMRPTISDRIYDLIDDKVKYVAEFKPDTFFEKLFQPRYPRKIAKYVKTLSERQNTSEEVPLLQTTQEESTKLKSQ